MVQMNNPGYNKNIQAQKLTEEQKRQIKQHLHKLYVGFVFINWSDGTSKLGTAKQKALQQLENFAKTFQMNKQSNIVSAEIARLVAGMKKAVSKQIMSSSHSEAVLSTQNLQRFRAFGENLVRNHMQQLRDLVNQAQKKLEKQSNIVTNPNPNAVLQMLLQQHLQNAA